MLGIFEVLKPKACQMMAECSIEQAHNMSELFRVRPLADAKQVSAIVDVTALTVSLC